MSFIDDVKNKTFNIPILRYIRTNGCIVDTVEMHPTTLDWYREKHMINQANTIEELCDAFILEFDGKIYTYEKEYFVCFKEDWYHDYLKAFDCGAMLGHEMSVNGYGAIWVFDDNGVPTLKPVAKMNEDGELCLI